jgi:hypothetical protein
VQHVYWKGGCVNERLVDATEQVLAQRSMSKATSHQQVSACLSHCMLQLCRRPDDFSLYTQTSALIPYGLN